MNIPRGDGMGGSRRGTGGGSRAGAGPGGECKCPKWGAIALHEAGAPCYFVKCPKCGSPTVKKTDSLLDERRLQWVR